MASIEDLLPAGVLRGLAALAESARPTATDVVSDDPPERSNDRAGGDSLDERGSHSASRSREDRHARHRPNERVQRAPRACVRVVVTWHARERARKRFPGFKTARIVDEVHAALAAGRVSALKPLGLIGGNFPYGLYVWTEDGDRIYGIVHGEDCFAVRTTMRRGVTE
jgi:hypothetical protein